MSLVSKTRSTMKQLINASKNMKISRDADVFEEISCNFDKQSITNNNERQMGNFTFQYLVSPNPTSTNTAPSITYDEIIESFDKNKAVAFKDNNLILIGFSYEQSDVIADPTTGSVSLSFSINITVTERIR